MRNIILFELNEVPFKVIDYYCKKFPYSTLAKILPLSNQYVTKSHDHGHLHPWSTWPTVHRGVSNEVHHIKDIGEDLSEIDRQYPPVWDILVRNNISAGVFSSLQTYPLPKNVEKFKFYFPDPFAAGYECHPASLSPFQKFSLDMSRKSMRNVGKGFDYKATLGLAVKLPKMGLRPQTVKQVIGQLADERLQPWKSNRRRTFQSILAFDIFINQLKSAKPQFATFFTNHAASAMHRYWAATFPDEYVVNNLSDEWINRYSGEIDFVMNKFDNFLKKIVKFVDANSDYKLIVASSMGQKATKAEIISRELISYDFDKFLNKIGVKKSNYQLLPAMQPQYNIRVAEGYEQEFVENLSKVLIKDKKLDYRQKNGIFFSVDLGHIDLSDSDITLNNQIISPDDLGLKNEKVDEEASGTAYHTSEGSMFVYDPRNTNSVSERINNVDTRLIAPSILANFGIEIPVYMKKESIPAI